MAVLGAFEDKDHWPEFGTLTVRDAGGGSDGGLFDLDGTDAQPCGTIARTGHGWLEAAAGDGPHTVRLESHDSAPADDRDAWAEAVEIPYTSPSGAVGLTYVTGGPGGDDLALPGPGPYRLRVARVDDRWLLRFWPVTEVEPPRWLARRRPPVAAGDPGWGRLLGYHATDLLFAVWAARDEHGGTTVEALEEWGSRHARGARWLDDPLPRPAFDELEPANFAAQLGVPTPESLRGLLDLFVAVGTLLLGAGGYRQPESVPRAQDVLDLSADLTARMDLQDDHSRFCSFASDLVSVALWGGTTQTVASLAERTLATEPDVRGALRFAEARGLLRIEGGLGDEFSLTVLGKVAGAVR